jgi:succinate dehydrogenase / fumarate reductase iron-sulfur subunit
MSSARINLTLKIWRQKEPDSVKKAGKGKFETILANDIPLDASFLEMLDIVNYRLQSEGRLPIAFDHDCREGICGACGSMVNGQAHGPLKGTTLCQLYMHNFKDGDTIVVEPWRSKAFPVIRDLVVDRSAFDGIIQAGGYISVKTGQAPDAHSYLISKENADKAMDAAICIGCGACVAACPNASAMLFVSAKVSQLALLPQGDPERKKRAEAMVLAMDDLGFGNCSNEYECEAACPKEIKVSHIARLNREYLKAVISRENIQD